MTFSKPNIPTNPLYVPLTAYTKSSRKLNSNGGTNIQILHSKKSTTDNHIHGILMKMGSTISTIFLKPKSDQTCFHERHKKSSIILMKIHIFLLITLLTCASSITSTTAHTMKYSSNTVKTKYGELRGIVVRNNPTVEAYLGIPYATPPTGSLRYMPPVTPTPWSNIRLADRFSPVCPQLPPISPTGREALLEVPRERLAQIRRLLPLLSNQSEDCLYLNLYVPRAAESPMKNSKPLAAIVYIHGESFEWNSGNPYDGSILAAHGNVIVITINFRLGVLGFLKTGSKGSAQGNFGLMDLVAAIHWLRENLPAFNGDPNKLTIMGHGTGASLANILITSPVVSDLIQRAILLSGSALSPWAIQKDPLYVKRKVAEQTGCHGDLIEDDLAPCLRTKPLSNLLSVQLETPRFLPGFAPFVDGTVIVANLNNSMTLPVGSAISSTLGVEMTDFSNREIIFGVTTLESYLDLSAQDLEFGFNETRRDRILRTYVRNNFNFHLNEIYAALKNEYTDWERPPRNPLGSRDAALELLSDGHTVAPLVYFNYLHSLRGGKSYFMHFNHLSSERDFPQRSGSVRGEDVPFGLGLPISPLFPHNYTLQDIKTSRTLVRYLSNFAHTGNPNESPSSLMHISQMKHNHIATPMDGINRLSKVEVGTKQKRQMIWSPTRKRRKRNRNFNYFDIDEDSDENEEEENEYDAHYSHNRDRLEETNDQPYPFWDRYDTLNQYYLEVGTKFDMKNHYRGHKLSLWLNLIPQLHNPGELNELSVKHHHFSESDATFYDGIVRAQNIEKAVFIKPVNVRNDNLTPTKSVATTATAPTDCPSNTTLLPTLAATRPQQDSPGIENKSENRMDGFLRHLTNSQLHSYSATLALTIGIGCFLLLLNILIFVGIYYQRVKRTLDAKKKEEFVETDIILPNFIDRCLEKNGEKSSLSMPPYSADLSYDNYNRYVEKSIRKGNICSIDAPIDNHKCKSGGSDSHMSFVRIPTHSSGKCDFSDKNVHISINTTPLHSRLSAYPSPQLHSSLSKADSSNSSELVTYQCQRSAKKECQDSKKVPTEHCNQSTQSEFQGMHDVGTTVTESDVDDRNLTKTKTKTDDGRFDKLHSTPSSLRSSISNTNYQQGGILRQQLGGPTTPSTSKKRVQIQEISV